MKMEINPRFIDWDSSNSLIFFNKKHPLFAKFPNIRSQLPCLSSHIWLATSGRTQSKLVALSKEAFLHSAHFVNQHILATSKDKWAVSLPTHHVGGLAILARAYLSKSSLVRFPVPWSALAFTEFIKRQEITLSSLVPAQVYDLVQAQKLCPKSLRAIIIGGDYLPHSLYQKARQLHWPLLPSYGLTECCSQVATAPLNSLENEDFPELQILPHVQVKMTSPSSSTPDQAPQQDSFRTPPPSPPTPLAREIALQSPSLLTGFVLLSQTPLVFQDPKKQGWYLTGDWGFKNQGSLFVTPTSEKIKILGESVNLNRLEETITQLLLKYSVRGTSLLLPVPHPRSGYQMALVVERYYPQIWPKIIQQFNRQVAPFEKIQSLYLLPSIPKSSISKTLKKDLLKILNFSTKPLPTSPR